MKPPHGGLLELILKRTMIFLLLHINHNAMGSQGQRFISCKLMCQK